MVPARNRPARRPCRGSIVARTGRATAGATEDGMADYERSTTVGVGADAAFAFLADPSNLDEYVGPITHVDSIAIGGDPAEADASDEADPAAEAHFLADA